MIRRIVIAVCLVMCTLICYGWWKCRDGLQTCSPDLQYVRCYVGVFSGHVFAILANQPMAEAIDGWKFATPYRGPEPFTFRVFDYPPDPSA